MKAMSLFLRPVGLLECVVASLASLIGSLEHSLFHGDI